MSGRLRRTRDWFSHAIWTRVAPPGLRWTEDSLRRLRRELPDAGLRVRVSPPSSASPRLTPFLAGWLRLRKATCLERSLIMQRWLVEVGQPHDVLIGVGPPAPTLIAHAWLDHEDPCGHEVMLRLGPHRSAA